MKKSNFPKNVRNEMKMQLPSLSINEGMARAAVAAFCSQLNPDTTELADIKCAISEAVTNCIVHAYKDTIGTIYIKVRLNTDNSVSIQIKDRGCGIPDIKQAREPLYTTDAAGERSGMGFTVMESFCDRIRVYSRVGVGTTVNLYKKLNYELNA
jgi:stage II sporulation protein AB (anti-sigma F factor)